MENKKLKMENKMRKTSFEVAPKIFVCLLFVFALTAVSAQTEQPPAPSAPKAVIVPAVKETKLPNGLTVAVVERRSVPIVTVQLLIRSGAASEDADKAGLANMTASLLTKGTKTRTATQIAEQIEFLGGSINSGASWDNSVVTINVMSDKLDQALAIMSDVVLNPAFKQEEIDLLKSQTLDGLTYNLKQPGFLANYVASKYSFNEHPAGGTVSSLNGITRQDIAQFHKDNFQTEDAVLIFTGDITTIKANALAKKSFAAWKKAKISNDEPLESPPNISVETNLTDAAPKTFTAGRILVVDLPNAGQASVNYANSIKIGRTDYDVKGDKTITNKNYYPATVLNSVLGGGYSSRLNQEIRIKRGLSYGAGSGFGWREGYADFSTRTQTKNESAAVVAELVLAEVKKLTDSSVAQTELVPRQSTLTGNFGRNLETTEGLAAAVADLYSFNLPTSELNSYTKNVNKVTDTQIREFAKSNLTGGDIIIVGDYAKFKDDLAKRFPQMKIEVVEAANLDLSKDNLQK